MEEIRVTLSSLRTWTPLWPQWMWHPSSWLTRQFVESRGALAKRPGCSSRRDGPWSRAYCWLERFSWILSEGETGRRTLTAGVKGWLGQSARVATGSIEYIRTIINKTELHSDDWKTRHLLENITCFNTYNNKSRRLYCTEIYKWCGESQRPAV